MFVCVQVQLWPIEIPWDNCSYFCSKQSHACQEGWLASVFGDLIDMCVGKWSQWNLFWKVVNEKSKRSLRTDEVLQSLPVVAKQSDDQIDLTCPYCIYTVPKLTFDKTNNFPFTYF